MTQWTGKVISLDTLGSMTPTQFSRLARMFLARSPVPGSQRVPGSQSSGSQLLLVRAGSKTPLSSSSHAWRSYDHTQPSSSSQGPSSSQWPPARLIAMQPLVLCPAPPLPPLTPPPKVLARPRGSIRAEFPWSPGFRPCPPPFTADKTEGCDQKKRKTLPRKVRCSSELGQRPQTWLGSALRDGWIPVQAKRALEMAGADKNAKNGRQKGALEMAYDCSSTLARSLKR